MNKAARLGGLFWLMLSMLCLTISAWAAQSSSTSLSCSPSTSAGGAAVINEVNSSDNYVELYLLKSTSIANWALYLDSSKMTNLGAGNCSINGTTTADSTTTYPAGTFIYCHDNLGSSHNISNASNEVLLVDKTGTLASGDTTVIDYLSYYVSNSAPNNLAWTVPAGSSGCGATYSAHSASNKDIARVPDGSGALSDNSNDSTPGTSNSGIATLTKTVSNSTPTVGSKVTFTISITANSAAASTNISVKDTLPAGLTYDTSSASLGSYDSLTSLWTIGTINAGATATLSLTAAVASAGTMTNTASLLKNGTATGKTASVSLTATVSSASSFDVVEVGNNKATNIYTKLVNTAFTLDVLALNSSGNLVTTYSNTPTVALVDASSGLCASMSPINNSDITITPGTWSGGRNTYTFTVSRAVANVRVRVIDGSITNCSTDNFSIRPQSLSLSQSGLSASPITAGTDFTLTASADVQGYTGTPRLLVSRTMVSDTSGGTQSAINTGMLTLTDTSNSALTDALNNAFPAANSTSGSTSLGLRYHDVGYLSFITGTTSPSVMRSSVIDDTFTSVDQSGDCVSGSGSNSMSGGKYGCEIWSTGLDMGRFKPDHFTVSNTLTAACSAGGFTYMDDPHLAFSLSVAAKSSQEITALKYGNACPTSGSCLLTLTPQNGTTALTASRLTSTTALPTGTALVGATYQSTTWANGAYTISGSDFTYARSTAQDGPYDSFNIKVAITDPDNVSISPASAATSNTTSARYGRLWIANAFGTSTRSLSIPLEAQYWNGLSFVQNTLDSCTSLSTNNIGLGNYHGTLSASNVGALSVGVLSGTSCTSTGSSHVVSAGRGCLLMAAPSSSSVAGSVDLAVDLGGTASANLCSASTLSTMTGANLAYLRGKWCNSSYDRDPSARATFGVFGSSAKKGVIYLREGY